MSRAYKKSDYKRFIDAEYMLAFFRDHKSRLFPRAYRVVSTTADYQEGLAAESYLTRYRVNVLQKNGLEVDVKLRGNRTNLQAYKMWRHLWKTFGVARYTVPKPVYFFPEANFVLYSKFLGRTLRDFPALGRKREQHFDTVLALVAKKIALLHHTKPKYIHKRTSVEERQSLRKLARKVREVKTRDARKVEQYLKELETLIEGHVFSDPSAWTLVHGDFQPSNIIYNRNTKNVGIIDFMTFQYFHPAHDVANFMLQLEMMLTSYAAELLPKKYPQKFLRAYLKECTKKEKEEIQRALPVFLIRSALDMIVLRLISPYYKKHGDPRKRLEKLFNIVEEQKTNIITHNS